MLRIDIKLHYALILNVFSKSFISKLGSWYSICRLINVIAIIVNGLVIAYTSKWSKTFLNDDSTNRLIFFVAFEASFLYRLYFFNHKNKLLF